MGGGFGKIDKRITMTIDVGFQEYDYVTSPLPSFDVIITIFDLLFPPSLTSILGFNRRILTVATHVAIHIPKTNNCRMLLFFDKNFC